MNIITLSILLVIAAVIAGTAILVSLPSGVSLSCSSDDDCSKTCYGCINKASFVEQNCTPSESLCKCIKNSCQYILNKQEVLEIVDEKFPDREKNITLIDEEEPYWNVSFSANGTSVSVSVSGSGEIIEETCNGVECNECQEAYTEIMPWGEIIHYNIGCDNPLPTCDISNICRPCETEVDCLRSDLSSTIRLDIGQILTQYYYSLIGTDITAHYNESSSMCTIDGIYTKQSSRAECEEDILNYVICTGECTQVS